MIKEIICDRCNKMCIMSIDKNDNNVEFIWKEVIVRDKVMLSIEINNSTKRNIYYC